jgi:two-component system cell cycle sensor histidine kinase/response regulator CckA
MEPKGRTILLVEDSGVVRDVVTRMLEGGGFTILSAPSGKDALSIARRTGVSFDLLLTDIVMPEMNGVELADLLAREHPGMRILFMTGYAEENIVNDKIYGKHRDCIGKPFTQKEITKKVLEILSS